MAPLIRLIASRRPRSSRRDRGEGGRLGAENAWTEADGLALGVARIAVASPGVKPPSGPVRINAGPA
jgi:hypothetical protein